MCKKKYLHSQRTVQVPKNLAAVYASACIWWWDRLVLQSPPTDDVRAQSFAPLSQLLEYNDRCCKKSCWWHFYVPPHYRREHRGGSKNRPHISRRTVTFCMFCLIALSIHQKHKNVQTKCCTLYVIVWTTFNIGICSILGGITLLIYRNTVAYWWNPYTAF